MVFRPSPSILRSRWPCSNGWFHGVQASLPEEQKNASVDDAVGPEPEEKKPAAAVRSQDRAVGDKPSALPSAEDEDEEDNELEIDDDEEDEESRRI